MDLLKTQALFVITAVAETVGGYLPYLWLKQVEPVWLQVPAVVSLGFFAWLLSLHPTASSRVDTAYGGVYILVAVMWLWAVDGVRAITADLLGVCDANVLVAHVIWLRPVFLAE